MESIKCAVNGCERIGETLLKNGLFSCDCGLHLYLVHEMKPPNAKITGQAGETNAKQ
jgi:hypothetical protein